MNAPNHPNDPLENKLRETRWRRSLTAAEAAELRAWLVTHPEAKADWEADAHLSQVLAGLADAPVSTNFTARVLQAVEREATAEARRREKAFSWSWRSLLPKAAVAAVVVCAGVFGYREHVVRQRTELAHGFAAFSDVQLTPDALVDFSTISRMPPAPLADKEILELGLTQ